MGTSIFHMFDYNLDHLGPGTIDDPAWKMRDRGTSYLARALAARGGLWGNNGYEAAYPMTYTDADTSNWLPAPAAPFRPIMRLYQPQAAVLDGTYKIPPITKAAS
jgi:hypothetical protein